MQGRIPSLLILIASICFVQMGAAANLATTAAGLGAGSGAVTACDGDGFAFLHTIDTAGRITTVTASGIAGPCAGGTLRLTLVNGTASVGAGSATLPSSGFTGSASIAVSPQPLSTGVTAVYATVEGP